MALLTEMRRLLDLMEGVDEPVLYHGTTRDLAHQIMQGKLEPRVGDFFRSVYPRARVRPVISAADQNLLRKVFKAIKFRVAQQLGKVGAEVTPADIITHGAVLVIRTHADKFQRATRMDHPQRGIEKHDHYSFEPVDVDEVIEGNLLARLYRDWTNRENASMRRMAAAIEKTGVAEAYQAGGYSAALWRRWWGNDQTGKVLPVDLRDDHDAYLFAHLDEFFTPAELQQLPDPEDVQSYETADPDDDIQNSSDEILIAAYNKGWHAILYDANNKHLSLRTSRHANLRGLRKIIRSITADIPVIRLIMEIGPTEHRLDGDEIERLIKFGRLPPR